MAIQVETELYEPVKAYFEKQGYEVKSEVNGCDLVAMSEQVADPVIVELKKSFTLSLLFQGLNRLKISPHVYLAVEFVRGRKRPALQKWKDVHELCARLGVGLITVTFYKTKAAHVEVVCDPPGLRTLYSAVSGLVLPGKSSAHIKRKTSRLIREFQSRSGDYNTGGSTNQKIVTAYRELALHCARLMLHNGTMSPLQLREQTGQKKVADILQKNYYGWFERVERGIYQLTPEGERALQTYADIFNVD